MRLAAFTWGLIYSARPVNFTWVSRTAAVRGIAGRRSKWCRRQHVEQNRIFLKKLLNKKLESNVITNCSASGGCVKSQPSRIGTNKLVPSFAWICASDDVESFKHPALKKLSQAGTPKDGVDVLDDRHPCSTSPAVIRATRPSHKVKGPTLDTKVEDQRLENSNREH